MPYCSQCGIEVDSQVKKCPLCGVPIQQIGEPELPGTYPAKAAPASKPPLSGKHSRNSRIVGVSFLFLLPLIITATINLLLSGVLSWSVYPIYALAELWLISILILLFQRKPLIYLSGILISASILLFIIDYSDKQIEWFHTTALPLTASLFLIFLVLFLIIRQLKRRGKNVAALVIIAIISLCFIIDGLLPFKIGNTLIFSWSIIVFVALFPVALLLLYMHYSAKKQFSFRKLFHL